MDDTQHETNHDHGPEQDERPKALTAFMIVIDERGQAQALMDYQDIEKFDVLHQPALQDIYRACTEVAKDVQAVETAQRCIQEQARLAQQAQRGIVKP